MFDWYGIDDIIWQTIRIILGATMIHYSSIASESYTTHSTIAGIGMGAALYYVFFSVFNAIMLNIWDCEALESYDALFMLDDKKNISNITGSLFFE
jgi:hypothetical protein